TFEATEFTPYIAVIPNGCAGTPPPMSTKSPASRGCLAVRPSPCTDCPPALRTARGRPSGNGRHRSAAGTRVPALRNGAADTPGGRGTPAQWRRAPLVGSGGGAPSCEGGCRKPLSILDADVADRPIRRPSWRFACPRGPACRPAAGGQGKRPPIATRIGGAL